MSKKEEMVQIEKTSFFLVENFSQIHQSIFQELCEGKNYQNVTEITIFDSEEEQESLSFYPMWGWMWLVKDNYIEDQIRKHIKKLSKLGLRFYERENEIMGTELWMGVEGAGFDFYEAIWQPARKIILEQK